MGGVLGHRLGSAHRGELAPTNLEEELCSLY